jgi:hypothetical protein
MPVGGDWHFVWAKAGDHTNVAQAATSSNFASIAALPHGKNAAILSAFGYLVK